MTQFVRRAAFQLGEVLQQLRSQQLRAGSGAVLQCLAGTFIIAQKLLPSIKEGVGRVPAAEIMKFTPSVRKAILEGADENLSDLIRMSEQDGMQDFTKSLKDLVNADLIDRAVALEVAPNVEALKMALKGIDISQPGIL